MDVLRKIPGFSGYMASEDGRIFSVKRSKHDPVELRPITKKGYLVLRLRSDDGRLVERPLHRLVAMAFYGDGGDQLVRHLDDNRMNNHLSNLAYGSNIDNVLDALRNGRIKRLGLSIMDEITIDWFKQMWAMQTSINRIAFIFGVGTSVVSNMAKKLGLPGRGRGAKSYISMRNAIHKMEGSANIGSL